MQKREVNLIRKLYPVEVCRLGFQTLVTNIQIKSKKCCENTSANVYREVVPQSCKRCFESALDFHSPVLDFKRIKMSTDGSVSGLLGGTEVVFHNLGENLQII